MRTTPLTSGEVAAYCHVTHRAVLKWIVYGKLKAYRTPGKHCRIEVKDFLDFLGRYQMPVPSELYDGNNIKKRILIVDDDKGMVHAVRRILTIDGRFNLEIAYDGFDAGRKFEVFKPDLVLLDLLMPGLNGYQVCSQIRNNPLNRNVKILVISGTLEKEDIKKIFSLGANDHLPKPFDTKTLKDRIADLLAEVS